MTDPAFLIVDLFCGAGGTTTGFEMAGGVAKVIAAVNHDHKAIVSHSCNHKHVKHFEEDIRTLDLSELVALCQAKRLQYPMAKLIVWASLECTNFSKAKGGKPRDPDSRTLADHLDRYVIALEPDYIQIENVTEFRDWGPMDAENRPIKELKGIEYNRWRKHLCSYGYRDEWTEMNAADYGAYTSRNRLFGIFAKDDLPIIFPVPTHTKNLKKHPLRKKWKAVKEVLNLEDKGESIFDRTHNMNLRKQDRKELVEPTLERIYEGLIKFVAGGQEAFLSVYNGGKPESRNSSMEDPARVVRTENCQALVQADFLMKYYSGDPQGKVISTDGPAGTVRCKDGQALAQLNFLTQRNGGEAKYRIVNTEGPARTLTGTGGNQHVVQPDFLTLYYGNGGETASIETASPVVPCKDRIALMQTHFLQQAYTTGYNNRSIEGTAGSILPVDKHYLMNCEPFVMNTNFTNVGSSIHDPLKTITGNRKWQYLMNPSWGGDLQSIDKPCPVIIARQDKAPLYLVQTEQGDFGIAIYDTDSPMTVKIKEFMVMYGIVDIYMRMLRVPELLRISGFPDKYLLFGSQQDQKKFIGNSVHPMVPLAWIMALHDAVLKITKAA